jgi:hypothetical protein
MPIRSNAPTVAKEPLNLALTGPDLQRQNRPPKPRPNLILALLFLVNYITITCNPSTAAWLVMGCSCWPLSINGDGLAEKTFGKAAELMLTKY